MDNKMELSIIIPVYNVEKYIDECLQSVIKQCRDNMEIILINDGSTDNSALICAKYCEQYEYIHLYNQENKGLSAARNTGIEKSRGRYLLFLDSDDFLKNDILGELNVTLPNIDVDFVLGKMDLYREKSGKIQESELDYDKFFEKLIPLEIFERLMCENFFWFTASLIIIKRKFLIDNHLYFKEGIYHEDELWVPQVFLCAKNLKVINKSIYFYRTDRAGSITNTRKIKREFDKIIILDEFDRLTRDAISDKRGKKIIKHRRATLLWIMIHDVEAYKNDSQIEQLEKMIKARISYLKHGKHIFGFWVCSILGIDNVRKLNLFCSRLCNMIRK